MHETLWFHNLKNKKLNATNAKQQKMKNEIDSFNFFRTTELR